MRTICSDIFHTLMSLSFITAFCFPILAFSREGTHDLALYYFAKSYESLLKAKDHEELSALFAGAT